jgi:hypothetical protein
MSAVTVRELERDGLLRRTVYPDAPPRVEYALTPLGGSFIDHVMAVANWSIVARNVGAVKNRDPTRHKRLRCLTMQASVVARSDRAEVASRAAHRAGDVVIRNIDGGEVMMHKPAGIGVLRVRSRMENSSPRPAGGHSSSSKPYESKATTPSCR